MNGFELDKKRKELRNLTFDALVDMRKVIDSRVQRLSNLYERIVFSTFIWGFILSCGLVYMLFNYDSQSTANAGVLSSALITVMVFVRGFFNDPTEKRDLEELSSEMELLIGRLDADSKRPVSDLPIGFDNFEARMAKLQVKETRLWKKARELKKDLDGIELS